MPRPPPGADSPRDGPSLPKRPRAQRFPPGIFPEISTAEKFFVRPALLRPPRPAKNLRDRACAPSAPPILPPSFPFRQISLVFLSPGTSLFDNCAASSARPSFPRTPFVPPDVADPPLPGRAAARFRRPCGLPPSAGLPYRPTLFPNGRISTVRPPIQG